MARKRIPVFNFYGTGKLIATIYNKQCMNTKAVIPHRALQAGYKVQYIGRSTYARSRHQLNLEHVGIPYYDETFYHENMIWNDDALHAVTKFLNEEWEKVRSMPDEEFDKVNTRTKRYQHMVWEPALQIVEDNLDFTDVKGFFYEVSTLISAQALLIFHLYVMAHLKAGVPVVIFDSDHFVQTYGWRLGNIIGGELPYHAERLGVPLTYTVAALFDGPGSLFDTASSKAAYNTAHLQFPYDPNFPVPKDTVKEPPYDMVYCGNDYNRTAEFKRFYATMNAKQGRIALVGDFEKKARTKRENTKEIFERAGVKTEFPGPVPYTEVFGWYHRGKGTVQISTDIGNRSGLLTPRVNDILLSKRLLLFSDRLNCVEQVARPDAIVRTREEAITKVREWWNLKPAAKKRVLRDQEKRIEEIAHVDVFWRDLCKLLGMKEQV